MACKKGCSKWSLVTGACVALGFAVIMVLCFTLQKCTQPGRSPPSLPPSLLIPTKALSPSTSLMASTRIPTWTRSSIQSCPITNPHPRDLAPLPFLPLLLYQF